jgi:hypothetical protein
VARKLILEWRWNHLWKYDMFDFDFLLCRIFVSDVSIQAYYGGCFTLRTCKSLILWTYEFVSHTSICSWEWIGKIFPLVPSHVTLYVTDTDNTDLKLVKNKVCLVSFRIEQPIDFFVRPKSTKRWNINKAPAIEYLFNFFWVFRRQYVFHCFLITHRMHKSGIE